ncbi:MAG: PIN domain-containing protein [Candidatus Electrothrix aestuarii]|uniref:PIN domain-containing protein n=1 Tax=Candidatus Electrothrix aestuarii TaxID=3062594 RepID=A0AAU8LWZ3_9BACT|nr:PIN domain-containing protein [Candidatus Electrothrix aestuarii]
MMKIYLDNCCIQQPLDDRTQLRIAVEGEIILNILSLIEAGQIRLLSSEISLYEAEKISNTFRREFTLKVLSERSGFTLLNDAIEERSRLFTGFGIKPIDALHLASAEMLKADFFCTCDDRFLKKAKKIDDLGVRAVSILELLQEMEK